MGVTLTRKQIFSFAFTIFIGGVAVGLYLGDMFKLPVGPSPTPKPDPVTPEDIVKPEPSRPENLAPTVAKLLPPAGPRVAGLTLPDPIEVTDPPQTIPIIARTKGDVVRWFIIGSDAKNPPRADVIQSLKMLLLHPARDREGKAISDQIAIFAYTTVDGVSTEPAVTLVKVNHGAQPPPRPDPKPDPAPRAKPRHVTFIFDYKKPTPAQTTIRNDASFRARLMELGVEYHEMSVLSEDLKKPGGLIRFVDKNGGAPVFVIQDTDGNVLEDGKFIDARTTLGRIEALHGGR